MTVVETDYAWASALTKRPVTSHLILHHAAGSGLVGQCAEVVT